jgi:hypothetical protein
MRRRLASSKTLALLARALLVVALCLNGWVSPSAMAMSLGLHGHAAHSASTGERMDRCAHHHDQGKTERNTPPCCRGGTCDCNGLLSAALPMLISVPPPIAPAAFDAAASTRSAPPVRIATLLRPPIA